MEPLDKDFSSADSVARVTRVFAFIDLSGFTAFTAKQGDAAAVDMLADFRGVVRRVCSRKGVRIAKWLGDGAMLVGLETEMVVEAIVDIERLVEEGNLQLALRGGIAAGPVILFEGDDYIGRPVNLAARLCDMADPTEILAPHDLISLMMVNTTAVDVGERKVSGLAEPIGLVRLDSVDAS